MSCILVWDFLEQLATAAIDIGQLDLANVRSKVLRNAYNVSNWLYYSQDCITRLDEHFPNSPRVEILRGLCIEAKDVNLAYKYYAELLQTDESNAVRLNSLRVLRCYVRRLLLTLHRQPGNVRLLSYEIKIN